MLTIGGLTDDDWANATRQPGGGTTTGNLSSMGHGGVDRATGATKYAYGMMAGDEDLKREGREAVKGPQY